MKRRRAIVAALTGIGLVCVGEATWIQVKAAAAQALINAAWNRNRQGVVEARPWPWADTTPVARLTLIRASDSAVAGHRARGESFVVLEGANGRNLAFGPTHDSASVLPGESGNSVIAAHRDTHFSVLQNVQPGDRIRVERLDGTRRLFTITDTRVVDSREARIDLSFDQPRLTLVTCYPFHAIQPGGPLRFVVTADFDAGAGNSPPPPVAHAAAPHEARPASRASAAAHTTQNALSPVSSRPTES